MSSTYKIADRATWLVWLPWSLAFGAAGVAVLIAGRGWERGLVAVSGVALGIAALRMLGRWRGKVSIMWTLPPWGIDVRVPEAVKERPWFKWFLTKDAIKALVAGEIAFWVSYAEAHGYGYGVGRVAVCMDGGSINFAPRRYSVTGLNYKVAGLANGKHISIVAEPDMPWATVKNTAVHEIGHVALKAMGVPQERHHEIIRVERNA